jgi:hypothetical protein
MHKEHGIFIRAIKDNKKVILTHHSGVEEFYITKLLVPVYYRPSVSNWSKDIYYFWDSEAKGNRLLVLQSSQIKFMELSEESFAKANYEIKPESDKDR